ncbi:hypothetical protein SDJN03_01779, partial [Cucurbita argyrosperma subsp. sororia]
MANEKLPRRERKAKVGIKETVRIHQTNGRIGIREWSISRNKSCHWWETRAVSLKFEILASLLSLEHSKMEWWIKVASPLRRFTSRVASRLGYRKRGLLKLGRDVKACEYEDVHVMWEMLKRNETEAVGIPEGRRRKKRPIWNIFWWARSAPCIGCRF